MTLEELVQLFQERVEGRYYGKYEGVVTDTADPLGIGRLRARIPAVLGEDVESGWCLPCAVFGGGLERGLLFVPEVGDTVWVEFAAGDLSRPIWSGAYWGAPRTSGGADDLGEQAGAEVPTAEGQPAGPGLGVLQTRAGHRLVFDDEGGVVVLAAGDGQAAVRLTRDGEVVIEAAKIKLGAGAKAPVVLGDALQQLFNQHTHPTGVGPAGPPARPLTGGQLSSVVFTE